MSRNVSRPRSRPKVVLVFGEDENDTDVIREVVLSLVPDFTGTIEPLRTPQIYSRSTAPDKVLSHVQRICKVISAKREVSDVVAVIVHRDCDAVEPVHQSEAKRLRDDFARFGEAVIAVTPAWETETWLVHVARSRCHGLSLMDEHRAVQESEPGSHH